MNLLTLTLCMMASEQWPMFRGPAASGVVTGVQTPIEWDVEDGTNIVWRAELPGLAHSSPIVWDDMIFVVTAESGEHAELKVGLYGSGDPVPDEGEHTYAIICLDRESGEVFWEEVCHVGVPEVKRHPKASHASSTPVTNGEKVVAFFGSEGLFCYDMDGAPLWERDLGLLTSCAPGYPDLHWGFASSPVIHENVVLVQCDINEQSFLAALDLETGEDVWRTDRDEDSTWGTPAVCITEDRSQVIANGYKHIGGYDLATGEELWKLVGGGDVPVPTPIIAHDLIYITNAHGRLAPIYAIRTSATGELTAFTDDDPHMAWSHPRRGTYMQTPLVIGERIYFCSDAGILACYNALTGEEIYRERLGSGRSGFSASGVACNDVLYYTGEDGEIHVVREGPEFERLAVNDMGETCMATPAIVNGNLYIRTRTGLVAVGAESPGG